MRKEFEHLADDVLFRLDDGELSAAEAATARQHLEACWNCRRRLEEVRQVIVAFAACYDRIAGAPPPNRWRDFPSRLRRQSARPSPRRLAPAWLSVAAAAAVLVAWLAIPEATPSASAAVILEQAARAEKTAPVIHQIVRVHQAGESAEWEVWRAHQTRSRFAGSAALRDRVLQAYKHFDAARPLSAAAFRRWHANATAGPVQRAGNHITIAASSPALAATITLRAPELQPVKQTLQIPGSAAIEIERIISEALDEMPPEPPVLTHQPQRLPERAPSAADLEIAEALLRAKLHETRADVTLTYSIRNTGSQIALALLAESEAQRDALLAELAAIPHLAPTIGTPESPVEVPVVPFAGARMERTPGALARKLVQATGSTAASEEYISRVHAAWRDAMTPALALERLSLRYPEHVFAALPDQARALIETIAADYLRQSRERARAYAVSLDLACQVLESSAPSDSAITVAVPWQSSAGLLVTRLRSLDAAFNRLFLTQEQIVDSAANGDLAALRRDLEHLIAQAKP